MGSNPRSSVVDKFGRTHDLSNLFVCDGSVLPTQGSANPGLTIQALAARTADYLIAQGESIFTHKDRDMIHPAIRRDLAPPGTYSRGIPRLANALSQNDRNGDVYDGRANQARESLEGDTR
jgi:hypothetical protein